LIAERTLRTPRGAFRCLVAGSEGAPTALCLHGFPDFAPSFRPTLEALAARGWHALAPWMRGYAPSTLDGPYDADSLAADVLAMVEQVSPRGPVALVGHDWGAGGS
jgi:pimeloyl-ACP methyl ester carboxylesterase